MKETGHIIRNARLKLGLSQKSVANELGYDSAQFVSNIERGVSDVPPVHIPKLVNLLKIDKKKVYKLLEKEYSQKIRSYK